MIGLEFIRKYYKDTAEQLAEKLNVSKVNISYWENSKKPIPKSRIDEIAKIYNVSPEILTKEFTKSDELSFLCQFLSGDIKEKYEKDLRIERILQNIKDDLSLLDNITEIEISITAKSNKGDMEKILRKKYN